MNVLIIAILLLILGILLWVLGKHKKGPKGSSSVGWVIAHVFGIVLTIVTIIISPLVIVFVVELSKSGISGYNDGYNQAKAQWLLKTAQSSNDPQMAEQAIKYAKKSMPFAINKNDLAEDNQIINQAKQIIKTEQKNQP